MTPLSREWWPAALTVCVGGGLFIAYGLLVAGGALRERIFGRSDGVHPGPIPVRIPVRREER